MLEASNDDGERRLDFGVVSEVDFRDLLEKEPAPVPKERPLPAPVPKDLPLPARLSRS